ncbi:hypothetical protein IMY05_C4558000100 [Salix suchowensis]|nr:hypothetical protein IMY05_C4558000100 [Salix suchowensis]
MTQDRPSIRSIVNGLRDDDVESVYAHRASFASEYSSRENGDGVQLPGQIGRLIEDLSQTMDSGSFNILPTKPAVGHSTTSSVSDANWTVEERLEHIGEAPTTVKGHELMLSKYRRRKGEWVFTYYRRRRAVTWGDTGGQWTLVLGDCQGPLEGSNMFPVIPKYLGECWLNVIQPRVALTDENSYRGLDRGHPTQLGRLKTYEDRLGVLPYDDPVPRVVSAGEEEIERRWSHGFLRPSLE